MKPITQKQVTFLSRLIARVGKEKYQGIEVNLGLYGLVIPQLTRKQAGQLIDSLRAEARR